MLIAAHYYVLAKTRFGVTAIVWFADKNDPRISRVFLPAPREKVLREIRVIFPTATKKSCTVVNTFTMNLQASLEGRTGTFDTSVLDLSRVPPFHRKVLRALPRISKGRVSTYGSIADQSGAPGGARAAGQGCANNPFPIIFPCHRVVRSDGSLGGFGGGLKLKRALLEIEGVRFDKNGKVMPELILR